MESLRKLSKDYVSDFMTNSKIKNEAELLKMFTADDGCNACTYVPFLHPIYNEVWATDMYILIRISPDRLSGRYEPVKGCERLKAPDVSNPCQLTCTYKAIRRALDACPLVDEAITEECTECDGTGKVEWEYTDENCKTHYQEFECPVCEGEGSICREHTGKKVHNEKAIIKIGNALVSWYYLDIVAKALSRIGADVVSITANKPLGMTEFFFDGIKIALVGLREDVRKGHDAEVELKKT